MVLSGDYTKTFTGNLKAVSLTPVLIPVYEHINDGFGEMNKINFASKLYLLLYDTDMDFMFLTGGGKSSHFGLDFSRNITPNFEIHGEYAFMLDHDKKPVNSDGEVLDKKINAHSYLLGIRYLSSRETTYILEYYRNGAGFNIDEMKDYYSFINKGYDAFLSTGEDSLIKKASELTKGGLGAKNPMQDYVYLQISQKEPFDILYFTPSIRWIYNLHDKSFSITCEALYKTITNLELRPRVTFIAGERNSEFGEKQNNLRMELRLRYYF
jgi:hypothetical protein